MAEAGTHSEGVLRELLAVFSFDVDTEALKKGESGLTHFFKEVKEISEGIAGVFMLREIKGFVDEEARGIHNTELMAQRLGILPEKVMQFQFAAESMGLSSEVLLGAMNRMQLSQAGAASGAGEHGKALSSLGVSGKDAAGKLKAADEMFLDVADKISKIKDPAKQATAAFQIFGLRGRELLPFLKDGRKGAEELFLTWKKLGGAWEHEASEGAKHLIKSEAELHLVTSNFTEAIASKLFPVMDWLVQKATKVVLWIHNLTKASELVKTVLLSFSVVATWLAAKLIIATLPILAIAAAITALILVVEDVIVLFEGGESLIGRVMDKIGGKGSSAAWIKDVRDAYHDIANYIKEAYGWWKKLTKTQEEEPAGPSTAGIAAGISIASEDLPFQVGLTREQGIIPAANEAAMRERAADAAEEAGTKTFSDIADSIELGLARGLDKVLPGEDPERWQKWVSRNLWGDVSYGEGATKGESSTMIPPQQMQSRFGVGGGFGFSPDMTVNAPITFHISGAGDPDVVADRIIPKLWQHFDRHTQKQHRAAIATRQTGAGVKKQ